MLDVSVLICTYNRETMLVDTIRDVLNQTYPSFEVIVVDQTVTHQPETQAYLASVQDRIKLIRQEPSLTKARNRALREARILIKTTGRLAGCFLLIDAHSQEMSAAMPATPDPP